MLIEIAGIDGSGKTTLISRLRKRLNTQSSLWAYERNFKSNGKRFLESIAMLEGFERPEDLFNADLIEFSNAVEMVTEVHRSLFFLQANSKQIYFVDHYQTSWLANAILRKITTVEYIRRIYSYLPKPDISVFIDVPECEALRRLNNREKGDQILALPSPVERLVNLKISFDKAQKLLSYTQIKLDGLLDISELENHLVKLINSHTL